MTTPDPIILAHRPLPPSEPRGSCRPAALAVMRASGPLAAADQLRKFVRRWDASTGRAFVLLFVDTLAPWASGANRALQRAVVDAWQNGVVVVVVDRPDVPFSPDRIGHSPAVPVGAHVPVTQDARVGGAR